MTYSREVTHLIVECWGLGLTAEETREFIHQKKQVMIALGTVYNHRNSITAQQIIDELIRKQQRDIAQEQNSDTRMKYRDKLLDKLIPHQLVASVKQETITRNVEELNVTLRTYEDAVQKVLRRYIREDSSTQPLDTASPPS